MDPEPSTSAGTSKAAGRGDGPTPTGVQEAIASTSGSAAAAVQQRDDEQFSINFRTSLKQCQQLFGATCRIKLQRCEVPTPVAQNNPVASVATPTAEESTNSRTADKVKEEDGSGTGSSSSEEDEVKVLAYIPPAAKKTAVAMKTGRKRISQRKSSSAHCTVCRKSITKWYLKTHMRKHTGENVYSCVHCRRSFWSWSGFTSHKKARNERNGVCPREMKRSGGWRPKGAWQCKICRKRLKHPSSYLTHMRGHRGEKRFKCEECGKAFVSSDYLKKHRMIHSQVWQFSCVFCGKGFHHRGNYWGHLRCHTEERPFFCVMEGCGASFGHLNVLKRHRRMVHLKKY